MLTLICTKSSINPSIRSTQVWIVERCNLSTCRKLMPRRHLKDIKQARCLDVSGTGMGQGTLQRATANESRRELRDGSAGSCEGGTEEHRSSSQKLHAKSLSGCV